MTSKTSKTSKTRRPTNPFAHLSDIGITRLKNLPEMLDCSPGTVHNYIKRGLLQKLRVGPNTVGVANADLKVFGEMMVQDASNSDESSRDQVL